MKRLFTAILYVSLIFLLWKLVRSDYLYIPQIKSYLNLLLSFIFLFVGNILQCLPWRSILIINEIRVSYKDAIISSGLSIFSKYVPGMVLSIVSRASYISGISNKPLSLTSLASLQAQIIALWSGFVLGSFIFINDQSKIAWKILCLISVILLTVFIIYPKLLTRAINLFNTIFKKKIIILEVSFAKIAGSLQWFILNWLSWCVGYYFLCLALIDYPITFLASFSFAFSATVAIAAIFAPAGLGVREGLLAASLIIFGVSKSDATSVAVISRFWFLIGEIFIFFVAVILKRIKAK